MVKQDYELFWKEALNLIRGEKGEEEFALWFNLEYLGASDNAISLAVPSNFYRDQVKQRYQDYIESKLSGLIGKNIAITFEVKSRETVKNAIIEEERPKKNPAPALQPVEKKKKQHSQLREDYIFDTYVVGENNNLAANAANAIARNPGTSSYNPLLIFGGVGLGKTHLMQAIGNYIHVNSENKVIFISAESFTNEFIESLGANRMAAFKNKYRYTDVLLIDDIHFLQNKLGVQEELFYTFNALLDANKQMVFTCDRPVFELKNFNDRLLSRLGQGLNVDILPPNYENRCAILKKKIETKNITIPDEVISLISRNISSNVRDLEGALTKLIAYTDLLGKPITADIAKQQLKDVFASPKQTNMSIDIIQRVVADYFSLSYNDLKGKKRTQAIVFPRQLAMYIAMKMTEYSTTEMGEFFGGRDHSTVMHSCKKIEERILSDPTMELTIENIKRTIRETSSKS